MPGGVCRNQQLFFYPEKIFLQPALLGFVLTLTLPHCTVTKRLRFFYISFISPLTVAGVVWYKADVEIEGD
jgi:hypothetical protein